MIIFSRHIHCHFLGLKEIKDLIDSILSSHILLLSVGAYYISSVHGPPNPSTQVQVIYDLFHKIFLGGEFIYKE